MNPLPDNQQNQNHFKDLARWFVLVPVVLLILFGCGQLALVSAQPPAVEGPLTNMQADYRVWEFTKFQPVTAGIMDEILKDRSRYANDAPSSIVLASGVVWPTQQAEQQLTPRLPVPTEQVSPTPPATLVLQPTATKAVTPTATQILWIPFTATNIPPENTRTPTATTTATETPTAIPTEIPTEIPTPVPPNNVNIGSPDGGIEDISGGGELIIDLVAASGNPLDTSTPDGAYDLVYYEYQPSPGIIMLDHVVLEVGTGPSGSCGSSTWTTVFYWGDADASNNGMLGSTFPGEVDKQSISFSNLYLGTTPGIAINIDALGASGIYPCLRIYSPVSGSGDAAQVDSIEILP